MEKPFSDQKSVTQRAHGKNPFCVPSCTSSVRDNLVLYKTLHLNSLFAFKPSKNKLFTLQSL